MSRKTWTKGNLHITYGCPSISPYYNLDGTDREVKGMDDVMYFYYNIDILNTNKVMISMRTHDFPKVQNLPVYIDEIMNYDMDKSYMLEEYKDGGFHRQVKYAQTVLEDSFGLDFEYFYKIERYDYAVKQSNETVYKKWAEYTLTIGEMEEQKKSIGDNREDFGKVVMIKNITPEELISLKNTALDFCEEAIGTYNKAVSLYEDQQLAAMYGDNVIKSENDRSKAIEINDVDELFD